MKTRPVKFFAALLFFVVSPLTHASMVLLLDDDGTTGIDVIIVDDVDGGVGTVTARGVSNTADGLPGDGLINFNGAVGSFSVNVTTGISKPIIGDSRTATIDLNSVNVSGSSGTSTLDLWLTDTDFFPSATQIDQVLLENLIGGTTDGTLLALGYLDPDNKEFGIDGFNSLLQGPFISSAFSSTSSNTNTSPITGPFSLTANVVFSHTAADQVTSFDNQLNARIPEPATLALMSLGLAGMSYKRRKQTNAV